ncbi:MAG: amino acid permease, partial [Armatimonadetes bacterium]|nr:amino acid permease [Armatimonadota bacterium]
WIGLFGLIASFHGIILGYSRQIFALARAGYMPTWLAAVHPRFKTPHRAILAGGAIGILAIFSDQVIVLGGQPLTANIITMSVFGALVMYVVSMLSLFKLRRTEPNLERPFSAPGYPLLPAIALAIAVVSLVTVAWLNVWVFAVFAALMAGGYGYFLATGHARAAAPHDELLEAGQR